MTYVVLHRIQPDYTRLDVVKRRLPRGVKRVQWPEVYWSEDLESAIAFTGHLISNMSEWWGLPKSEVPYKGEMSIVRTLDPVAFEGSVRDEPQVTVLSPSDLSAAASWSRVGNFELSDASVAAFEPLFTLNALRLANERQGMVRTPSRLVVQRRPNVRSHRRSR